MIEVEAPQAGAFILPSAPIWRVGSKRLVLNRPHVMGILNVTPDSFSDGGQHNSFSAAIDFAMQMVDAGADIIDVGGESTRPGADAVSVKEELSRVLPVVQELASRGIIVSIDTYHPQVAQECVDAGAVILNDISGFQDPKMIEVAANSNAGVIPMHMAGTPKNMQANPRYNDVTSEIAAYLIDAAQKLQAAGIDRQRICIDPGPGFGKTARHNMQILGQTQQLSSLGYPLMAAFSRKSTLGQITGVQEASQRVESSVASALLAYCGGARIFRVHDVEQTVQALQVASNAHYAHASKASGFATMLPGKRALVALGSNMGESVENIVNATRAIDEVPGISVIASSSIYRTEPAYYEDQDNFANSVIWVQTTLGHEQLLDSLFVIENEFLRRRTIENGPRTLDLDVLDYEGVVSNDPKIILPHPRILERDFTVTPILELEQIMRDTLGIYVDDEIFEQLGTCAEGDAAQGGFRLSNKQRVTSDNVQYGNILGRLLDAEEVF